MTLNQFINAASVSCVLFLALLSFLKKSDTPSGYRFLALLFVLLAASLTGDLLEDSPALIHYPWLIILFEPVLFALPPVIYFAVKHLTGNSRPRRVIRHFIPYFLLLCLYLLSNPGEETPPAADDQAAENTAALIIVTLFFVQIAVYLYHSLRLLRRHRERLPFFVADFPGNDLNWLRNTVLGLCFLTVIMLLEVVFTQIRVPFYFSAVYLLGLYYVGVQIVGQKDVVTSLALVPTEVEENDHLIEEPETAPAGINDQEPVSDRKQVLTEEQLCFYKEQLLTLMETSKPFLDNDITLPGLGNMLSLNTYQVSYLINTCFSENFYVFINRYRLERCKQLLTDPAYAHLSILGIAFESGFNSKTAFNTSFKKSTGLSPRAYRDKAALSDLKEVPVYQNTDNE